MGDPRTPALTWWEQAACKGQPTDLFFPTVGNTTTAIRDFCDRCPVRISCLADAVAENDWIATRGGMSANSRRRVSLILKRLAATGDNEGLLHVSRMSKTELLIMKERGAA